MTTQTRFRCNWTEEDGAEAIEWIAWVAGILLLLVVFSSVFEQAGAALASQIITGGTAWINKWTEGTTEAITAANQQVKGEEQAQPTRRKVATSVDSAQNQPPSQPLPRVDASPISPERREDSATEVKSAQDNSLMDAAYAIWILPDQAANLSPITAVFSPETFMETLNRLTSDKTILPKAEAPTVSQEETAIQPTN